VLISRYRGPVVAFLRCAGLVQAEEADDLAHDFFADKFLSGHLIDHYQSAKGSFRPFLKEALRNYARSRQRHDQARMRRPEGGLVHPDQETGGWVGFDSSLDAPPEAAFHAAWVRGLLDEALAEVRTQCERESLMQHYAVFAGRYLSDGEAPKWSALAAPFGWDEKQARNRADIVAARLRKVLIGLVAADVGSEQLAQDEIQTLLALL
jgi:DNA-directed RNA polymerase specialized sigma24 family protein